MVRITAQNPDPAASQSVHGSYPPDGKVKFSWLAQAGFLFAFGNLRFMVDPYLSDSLARKYAGAEFDHKRMMPAPVRVEEVTGLDRVLCTHGHSDHMDPETLSVLLENNSQCRLIAPAAERDHIRSIGLDTDRVVGVNAGDTVSLNPDTTVRVIASAHEQIKTNDRGEHHFLGFVIRMGSIVVYHSGDCVPYDGLEEKLADKQIDVAFLPVNGRDDYRRQRNIAGNFTFQESFDLCRRLNIPQMVCHHFGMFGFNTIEPEELRRQIERTGAADRIVVPEIDKQYTIEK